MSDLATILEADRGDVVCERCRIADAPLARLRGLLGRRELPPDEGILIRPTSAVHMAFMRFPIDAVFLTRDLRVLAVVPNLRPWRVAGRRGSHAVLELAAGEGERRAIRPGDRLIVADAASAPSGRERPGGRP